MLRSHHQGQLLRTDFRHQTAQMHPAVPKILPAIPTRSAAAHHSHLVGIPGIVLGPNLGKPPELKLSDRRNSDNEPVFHL